MRVVRLRPALIFKRESATEQRRYFGGPFVPGSLLRGPLRARELLTGIGKRN